MRAEWGFEGATPAGIDHVLVRGLVQGRRRSGRWSGAARQARALRPRAGRSGGRVTHDEARALFPVLERYAYLNAGTLGPLAQPTLTAMEARPATTRSRVAAGGSGSRACSICVRASGRR